jgi:hypothetical protein
MSLVSVVCFQVKVIERSQLPVQGSPTHYDVSLCVI